MMGRRSVLLCDASLKLFNQPHHGGAIGAAKSTQQQRRDDSMPVHSAID